MAKRFPAQLHVRWGDKNYLDPDYLRVEATGVSAIDEDGTPFAIYKLDRVGTVRVQRFFIPKKSTR